MEEQLLIKSFGYGVFLAELVPPEVVRRGPPKNGDGRVALENIKRRIQKSGLPDVLDVVPDPEDVGRAYFVLRTGQPPCKIEMDYATEQERSRMKVAAEASASSVLSSRILMLDEASKSAVSGKT
jgi:hypothetical protein